MSFNDSHDTDLPNQLNLPSYSFQHSEPSMNLAEDWVYNNMVSNIPSYPAESAYLASFEEGSGSTNTIGGAPFQNHLSQDPYASGFLLSAQFNSEDYGHLQLPQQQHIHPSSAPPSYYHPSTTPTIKRAKMTHSPVTSYARSLSLNSSPSPSPAPSSPERQPRALLSSSTIYRPGPIPVPTPFITATMAGTEESRRRGRRREQNRKAQFIFRQKRKDEVQRLQLEVLHLKERLASAQEDTKWRQMTTIVNGCGGGAGADGMVLCALCKAYAAQCQ